EKPVRRASRIHHSLPDCRNGTTDVGRDEIFRTLQKRWLPVMMIGKAEPHRRDSYPLHHAAKLNLAVPFAVPLWKDDDGQIFSCRKESTPDGVVFGKWCSHTARKFQDLAVEFVLCRGFIRIETVAIV